MKSFTKFSMIVFLMISIFSCSKDSSEDGPLTKMDVSAITTSSSVELVWVPIEGAIWYQIYMAKEGESLELVVNHQDLTNNPIRYTINDLEASTIYDVKMEGTDYASGGKLIVSKTFKMVTQPVD